MKTSFTVISAALVAAALACGCDNSKTTAAPPKTPATLTHAELPPSSPTPSALPAGVDASVSTSGLRVSDAIARACNLPKTEARTSFEFDSSTIGEDDKALLAAVARCLTEGALKGQNVSLVGRADPRGENEYNMSLGGTRSDSVRKYMSDLGVQRERLAITSRGELDATGTDEAGWAKDRRVDIELVK